MTHCNRIQVSLSNDLIQLEIIISFVKTKKLEAHHYVEFYRSLHCVSPSERSQDIKKVSEYDLEIPESHISDQLTAP